MPKKSFKNINPANAFISSTQTSEDTHLTDNTHNTHNEHKTHNTVETKSKRLNLILRPSLFKEFTKVAHMKRTSVNDLLNQLMTEYIEREAESIQQYNKTFEGE
jgi:predicted HicB family RNase H-like nuclease